MRPFEISAARLTERQLMAAGAVIIALACALVALGVLAPKAGMACDSAECADLEGDASATAPLEASDIDGETAASDAAEASQDAADSAETADAAETAASGFAQSVRPAEAFLQYPAGLDAGCEPVSLTLALRSLGFDIDPETLISAYMPTDFTWTDAGSYMGSPYDAGGSFPPGMVNTANAFFEEQESSLRAVELTGAPFSEIADLASQGVPVLVWTTMYESQPAFSGQYIGGYAWYTNEHCVLLYGIEDGMALVSDPLEGLVQRDLAEFASLYEACGAMAVSFSS